MVIIYSKVLECLWHVGHVGNLELSLHRFYTKKIFFLINKCHLPLITHACANSSKPRLKKDHLQNILYFWGWKKSSVELRIKLLQFKSWIFWWLTSMKFWLKAWKYLSNTAESYGLWWRNIWSLNKHQNMSQLLPTIKEKHMKHL